MQAGSTTAVLAVADSPTEAGAVARLVADKGACER
jgi:hypothetical protein